MKKVKAGLGYPDNVRTRVIKLRNDNVISAVAIEYQLESTKNEDVNEIAFRVVQESTTEKNPSKSAEKLKPKI